MADPDFSGKVVVVTAAAHGVGQRLARAFSQAGAHVVLADADGRAAREVAAELADQGYSASGEGMDVREPLQSEAVVDRLVREHGKLDVWVNNAHAGSWTPAENVSREQWNESVGVVLSGTFFCCQAAGRWMLAHGGGTILNVSSVDGYQPVEGSSVSSMTQAGVIMLTQALGIEWAKRGVRVVGIALGAIEGDQGHAPREAYERRTPMRRLATPDEIAEAALFLASDQASYVVGETMRVDGGWVAYQLF